MLAAALGDHRITEHDRVGTHAGEQSLEWQKQIATERLNQLRQQAAIDYTDPTSIEAYARASESAGRERARALKLASGSEGARAEIDAAHSSIWRSAVEAALDRMHTASALDLLRQAGDRLSPTDAAALAPLIDVAKEHAAGQDYLTRVQIPDSRDLAELEIAHLHATARNEVDWSHKDSQRATNQHLIDLAFGQRKQEAVRAKSDLDQAVNDWVARPGEFGRPPIVLWASLNAREREAVDSALKAKASKKAPTLAPLPQPSLKSNDMYGFEPPSLYERYRPGMPEWVLPDRPWPPIDFAPRPAPTPNYDGPTEPRGIPEEDNVL